MYNGQRTIRSGQMLSVVLVSDKSLKIKQMMTNKRISRNIHPLKTKSIHLIHFEIITDSQKVKVEDIV